VGEPLRLAWLADGATTVAESLEVSAAGRARLVTLRSPDPDRLDRAGVFELDLAPALCSELERAADSALAGPRHEPRPGALVLAVQRGDADAVVPAPASDAGPPAELHRIASEVAGQVAASPVAAVRLLGSTFGPLSVAAGGIPRIDLESIGSRAVVCVVHLAGLRFVAATDAGEEDWLDPVAVERTGGLLTSLGRLVARDETPANLEPGVRGGLAIPGGLRPSGVGRRRLHARLPVGLGVTEEGDVGEVELVTPWFDVDVGP
jgi:hypothetical protein